MWTNKGKMYSAGITDENDAKPAFDNEGLRRLVGFSSIKADDSTKFQYIEPIFTSNPQWFVNKLDKSDKKEIKKMKLPSPKKMCAGPDTECKYGFIFEGKLQCMQCSVIRRPRKKGGAMQLTVAIVSLLAIAA